MPKNFHKLKQTITKMAITTTIIGVTVIGANAETLGNVTGRVNFRKKTSTKSEIITKIRKNSKVMILGKKGNWYKIKYNGNTGYVSKKYVEKIQYSIEAYSATLVAKQKINVRKGPSTKYTSIGKLKAENKITAIGKVSNGWYKVMYNNQIGYITGLSKYVSILNDAPIIETKNDVYEITQNQNSKSEEELKQIIEATATDKEDGNLTDKITFTDLDKVDTTTPKDYIVTLTVKDKDGKTITKTITIKVLAAPTIIAKDINVEAGTTKSQIPSLINATATDRNGNSIIPTYEGIDDIDTSNVGGIYTVTVKAVDLEGITTTKDIKVTVVSTSSSSSSSSSGSSSTPTPTPTPVNNAPTIEFDLPSSIIEIKQYSEAPFSKSLLNMTVTDEEDGTIPDEQITFDVTFNGKDNTHTEDLNLEKIKYDKLGTYIIHVTATDSQKKASDAYVLVKIIPGEK